MSSLRPFRRAVAMILAAALAAAPVHAFNLIGSSANPTAGALLPPSTLPAAGIFRHWDLREFPGCAVPYAINQNGTIDHLGNGFAPVESAADSWTNVAPALISLSRQANTAIAVQGMDNANVFAWDNNNNSGLFGAAPSSILGVTAIYTQVATGIIQESDIIFNDRDYQWNETGMNLVDVQSGVAPFNVNNGQTLTISVDGGANQTVTFAAVTNGAATAAQIGQNIINQVAGVNVFVVGGNRVKVTSQDHNGTGTIDVNGGTAAAAIGFPAGAILTDAADIETIALHEIGHFLGIHHASNDPNEPNPVYTGAVMYWAAPSTGTKRVLTADDQLALNFLYTPDLGDAPDPTVSYNFYQSLVHSTTASRTLNGVQLFSPGRGPEHLFDYWPQDTLKLEWLGPITDGVAAECEARVADLDLPSDDGVQFLQSPLYRGQPNGVKVFISYRNAARYAFNAARRLYLNGYFDWPDDKHFDPPERDIWWAGDPTNGTFAASPTWTGAYYGNPGVIELTFQVTPPVNAPSVWARFRLDLGEDENRVANINGDLWPAEGGAQFGEVEDYYVPTTNPPPTAVLVGRFDARVAGRGVDLSWSTPQGGVSTRASLYRTAEGVDVETFLATVDAGPDGARYRDEDVVAGTSYHYRLGLFDTDGEVAGPSIRVVVPAAQLALAGIAPNPTERGGTVTFTLPSAGQARLALFGVDGRRVRTLADRAFDAGTQRVEWDGNDEGGHRLAPGVYFLKLMFGSETRVSRTLVIR
jgi:hypothetical protein